MCVITATHCNTLQHTATHFYVLREGVPSLRHTATHCNILQHTATHCDTLQRTSTYCEKVCHHCNTLQHTATYCNTLQHTATHCNTLLRIARMCVITAGALGVAQECSLYGTTSHNALQYAANIAIHCNTLCKNVCARCRSAWRCPLYGTATHCTYVLSSLQHTAMHCNTLQCTATT